MTLSRLACEPAPPESVVPDQPDGDDLRPTQDRLLATETLRHSDKAVAVLEPVVRTGGTEDDVVADGEFDSPSGSRDLSTGQRLGAHLGEGRLMQQTDPQIGGLGQGLQLSAGVVVRQDLRGTAAFARLAQRPPLRQAHAVAVAGARDGEFTRR